MISLTDRRSETHIVRALLVVLSLAAQVHVLYGQQSDVADKPKGLALKTPAVPANITGVLREVNEKLLREVRPEDNAAVTLLQIFGADALEPKLRVESLEMMGIESLPTDFPSFIYVEEYVKEFGYRDAPRVALETNLLQEELMIASGKRWTRADCPKLFDYLRANRAALDIVVQAANKSRYYAPVLSAEDPPQLLSASLTIERRLPFLARCLAARGLLVQADSDLTTVRNDLIACLRLAELVATGSPFDVSQAKAELVDALGTRAAMVAVTTGVFAGKEAAAYLEQLKHVRMLPPLVIAADQGERAIVHQELEFLQSEDSSVREFLEFPDAEEFRVLDQLQMTDLDWMLVREQADKIQDALVKALSTHDREQQQKQFATLDDNYRQWEELRNPTPGKTLNWASQDRATVSRFVGETVVMSLRPLYWQRRLSDDRVRVRRNLLVISTALMAYHNDHQDYPQELSSLSPDYLDIVPEDSHADRPFTYARLGKDRARLITWGTNREDDAGRSHNDDTYIELH